MPRVAAAWVQPERVVRLQFVELLVVLRGELRVLRHLAGEQVELPRPSGAPAPATRGPPSPAVASSLDLSSTLPLGVRKCDVSIARQFRP